MSLNDPAVTNTSVSPPGYRSEEAAVGGTTGTALDPDHGRCFRYLTLVTALLGFSALHTLRQAELYGNVTSELSAGVSVPLFFACCAIGWWWRQRGGETPRAERLLLTLAVVSATGGPLLLLLMPRASATLLALLFWVALQGLFVAATAAEHVRWYLRPSLDLGFVNWLVQPWQCLGLLAFAAFSLLLMDRTGVSLFPTLLGLCFWGAALGAGRIDFYLGHPTPRRRDRFASFVAAGVGVSAALVLCLNLVSAEQKERYGSDILYVAGDHNSQELVLVGRHRGFVSEALSSGHATTSGVVGGTELFVDERLHFGASLGHRYARAVVSPLFEADDTSTLRPPLRRVLSIGTGSGIMERQLLRHRIDELWVVAPSEAAYLLNRRLPWFRDEVGSWHDDPRVRFHVDDAVPWLNAQTETFDAIVVDVPPPVSVRSGVYYTKYFLQLLRSRLTPDGIALMPGLSLLNTRDASTQLRATARAAGFTVSLREAAWPGAGDWSVLRLSPAEPQTESDVSTLQNLSVVDTFTREYAAAMGIR